MPEHRLTPKSCHICTCQVARVCHGTVYRMVSHRHDVDAPVAGKRATNDRRRPRYRGRPQPTTLHGPCAALRRPCRPPIRTNRSVFRGAPPSAPTPIAPPSLRRRRRLTRRSRAARLSRGFLPARPTLTAPTSAADSHAPTSAADSATTAATSGFADDRIDACSLASAAAVSPPSPSSGMAANSARKERTRPTPSACSAAEIGARALPPPADAPPADGPE
mmetsp:Transcript_44501/g.131362  ORF Transcript_44501/g.131362 Transcript_44501/m.131362 type:complete len:220 (+) Transcript_44501:212-871(+)